MVLNQHFVHMLADTRPPEVRLHKKGSKNKITVIHFYINGLMMMVYQHMLDGKVWWLLLWFQFLSYSVCIHHAEAYKQNDRNKKTPNKKKSIWKLMRFSQTLVPHLFLGNFYFIFSLLMEMFYLIDFSCWYFIIPLNWNLG